MPVAMLKLAEAAVVARVALRDVNRVFDEGILPDEFVANDDGRRVMDTACTFISFYFDSAAALTAEARLSAIREGAARLKKHRAATRARLMKEDWTVRDGFLTIDLAPFLKRTLDRIDRLNAARAMVATDPDILGGTPIMRGTRVPVYDVAASVAAGLPKERILAAYPSLDAEKLELAALFAEANPPRGRPRAGDGSAPAAERRVRAAAKLDEVSDR
jgi:uncharacterized protein (DUF433 family)